jgi:lipopolysaccharide/colanic/teichoic acid biosynthesis glycosyltransferase
MKYMRVRQIVSTYTKATILGLLAVGATVFIFKISVSRALFGYFFAIQWVLLIFKQLLVNRLVEYSGINSGRRHAIVIGPEDASHWFASVVRSAKDSGYVLEGILYPAGNQLVQVADLPVLGTVDAIEEVLRDRPINEVFIVGNATDLAQLGELTQTLIERGRTVLLVTIVISGDHGIRGRVTSFAGIPMISFGPQPTDQLSVAIQRAVDVTVVFAFLTLFSWLYLDISLLVLINGGLPILFRQERLGYRGQHFMLYKFRTMLLDAEHKMRESPELYEKYIANDYKLPAEEDPRISTLGHFLRRTSLDELPQFWNVLTGEMTLVGPRPIVPNELNAYAPYGELLLSVKPGC